MISSPPVISISVMVIARNSCQTTAIRLRISSMQCHTKIMKHQPEPILTTVSNSGDVYKRQIRCQGLLRYGNIVHVALMYHKVLLFVDQESNHLMFPTFAGLGPIRNHRMHILKYVTLVRRYERQMCIRDSYILHVGSNPIKSHHELAGIPDFFGIFEK